MKDCSCSLGRVKSLEAWLEDATAGDILTALCNPDDSWSQVSGVSQGKGELGRDGGGKLRMWWKHEK